MNEEWQALHYHTRSLLILFLILALSHTLAIGNLRETFSGTLTAASPITADYRYLSHTIILDAPDVLFAYLHSDDFDAYLVVTDADGQVLAQADDDMGTDALVTVQLPQAGTYHLFAAAKNHSEGDYWLFMQLDAAIPNRQYIGMVGAHSVEIHDGTFAEAYPFYGRAGQSITVWARSDAFEPHLSMFPSGVASAEHVNNQTVLRHTLDQDGFYVVFVHSYGDFGDFSIKISNDEVASGQVYPEPFVNAALQPTTRRALGLTGPVHTLQTYEIINGETHQSSLHTFDRDGNEIERRTRFGEHYRWNAQGWLLERSNETITEFYTYTEEGEPLAVWLHDPSHSGEPYLRREYSYTADGKVARRVDYDADGFVLRVLQYAYSESEDRQGRFIKREAFDSRGDEVETLTLYYDSKERLIREEHVGDWAQGGTRQGYEMQRVTRSVSYEYDEAGWLRCRREYTHRCFDEHGQPTLEREFSHTQGLHEKHYLYDDSGRLQYVVSFTDNCSGGFCYTVTRFDQYAEDSQGNWTNRRRSQAHVTGNRFESFDFISALEFIPQSTEPREVTYWPLP